ncbi:methylenetetrahydrofolate reductase [NAD(P)H] [Rhodospirillum rubrum]|uniref:methylenetetrahydrofolate reductase [NAD(P)H] n=1 Tax=Rhodospirillum rubrum TaxID=1085 RepID=UPI001906603A|nr:methylenetetrahydrofolate reductase [NAD(P)H] [Rhodospirillum rubrum]MBK1663143.1 methylenetetrahydrofolate reductase [NAD(P)H] [Rhodospirillum rubrum]MBK1675160.1 methylenetetrahydrofolate reductase [NAD(P)H] [Rhodospirillum rubrum]
MTVTASPLIARPRTPRALSVSFEFFPPKTDRMRDQLWECLRQLEPLEPSFVSVTYGAGGSTRERTHETVARIAADTTMKPAAHLTCVEATRAEVNAVAQAYWQAGVRHVVALRGDPPTLGGDYIPHPGGYAYALDLVKGLRDVADFEISVAAYPEVHPQARSAAEDLDNLKRKIDAGATRAISQYFFDVDSYRRFMDRVLAAGISVPVVPGILPVGNFQTVLKFSNACGTRVPKWMHELFAGLENDPETHRMVAATLAAEQCLSLFEDGVDCFHFYTLNRADLVRAVCHMLGLRPAAIPAASRLAPDQGAAATALGASV